MRKLLIMLTSILLLAGVANAGDFIAEKQAGDVTVRILIGNNPLSVGANDAIIELHDGTGQTIADAEVSVYLFMPVMPAMHYEVKAEIQDNKYAAVIKPTMPGTWEADIKVKIKGGEQKKVTFSFEAK